MCELICTEGEWNGPFRNLLGNECIVRSGNNNYIIKLLRIAYEPQPVVFLPNCLCGRGVVVGSVGD